MVLTLDAGCEEAASLLRRTTQEVPKLCPITGTQELIDKESIDTTSPTSNVGMGLSCTSHEAAGKVTKTTRSHSLHSTGTLWVRHSMHRQDYLHTVSNKLKPTYLVIAQTSPFIEYRQY